MDVAEVAFQALAGVVGQRDEGLTAVAAVLADVAADLVVAAGIAVLVAQAAVNLAGKGCLGGATSSAARMASMAAWKAPRTGAGVGLVRV